MWKKKIYIKNNLAPFELNRTKIDLFYDCKKCFFLNIKKGIRRPHGPPSVLNNTVVKLVKDHFNLLRLKKDVTHKIINNEKLIPINHQHLEIWRNPLIGLSFIHKETNLKLTATLNDLWFDNDVKKICVVDFKSTSKNENFEESMIWSGYWRHLAFYKYLLEKNGLDVSNVGYLLLLNGKKNQKKFENKLLFDSLLFSRTLDNYWVDNTIYEIYNILENDQVPKQNNTCSYCSYFSALERVNGKL
tara:strand:- start:828 stop:1562 length:735 start_codon:yes stop_codon:yes gene_type:complete